jgi:hypothetical protein
LKVGAKTRAGGGGYQPTIALGVQARTSAMMGCRSGINGRVDWLRGAVVNAGIELVLQRAARALFLDGAG